MSVKSWAKSLEFSRLHPLVRRTAVRLILQDPWTQANISNDLIFVHVPKTAGTSICEALGQKALHIPISRFAAYDPARFTRCKKIAFVRNPWIRLSSAYNYLQSAIGLNNSTDVIWATQNLSEYKDFGQFVLALKDEKIRKNVLSYIHFRPQSAWLGTPGEKVYPLDFLGRFERLEEDVHALSTHVKRPIEIGHLRKPQKKHNPAKWTEEMVEIVRKIYANDIAQFKYEHDAPKG